MRKYLYHATDKRNEEKIMNEGLLPGIDGGVYFAASPDNALKFMAFKFEAKEVIVLKVRTRELDPKLMEESFDHSEMFFQCKASLLQVADNLFLMLQIVPTTDNTLHYECWCDQSSLT